jgi:hypothetical protein
MEESRGYSKMMTKTSRTRTSTSQPSGIKSKHAREDRPLVGQVRKPKERKPKNIKPESKPREGMDTNKNFPYVSQIVPKSNLCNNPIQIDNFLDQLLQNPSDGNRPMTISPSENDGAHDHDKGMCLY